jgi:predicted XRE-type DNA-binding protein
MASKQLSEQIRKAIDASGMSRYRICKEIGMPESNMSVFMGRKVGLSMATLDRLAAYLDLRICNGGKGKRRHDR